MRIINKRIVEVALVSTVALFGAIAPAAETWQDSTVVESQLGSEAASCKEAHEQAKHANLCAQGKVKGRIAKLDIDKDCSCQGFRGEDQEMSYLCQVKVTATCATPDPAGLPAQKATGASGTAGPSPSPSRPEPRLAGAPSEAECQRAVADAKRSPANQSELNLQSHARATLAAFEMGHAYADLMRATSSNPVAAAKLEAAQKSWDAYLEAHQVERFPHQDEQWYYGSIFPMCANGEYEGMVAARGRELHGEGKCREGASTVLQAKEAARIADVALNDAYGKVRSAYVKEPKFLVAFQRAELAWMKLRDAQVDFVGESTGGPNSACAQREVERVTRARTEAIRAWLKPLQEGDSCVGSYGSPQ